MTISKTAIYGKEQALQDIYSNIDVIERFIARTKAQLLQDNVQWQRIAKGAKKDLIDVPLAENAAASIHTLATAEINGGYQYLPAEKMVPSSEGTLTEIRAKRERVRLRLEEDDEAKRYSIIQIGEGTEKGTAA